jgi:predicted acylesterase/phospholipase RssA
MSDPKGHRHAVILSGGGAYGAYEVGAMTALFNGQSAATDYQPLDAEIFTGTSAGALNAAFMTMRPGETAAATVSDLERIWIEELSDHPRKCGNGVYRFRGDPLRFFEPECVLTQPAEQALTVANDAAFFAEYVFTRGTNFLRSSAGFPERAFHLFDLSAFISVEPLRHNIRRFVEFDGIRRSHKSLSVATTNWVTGDVKVFQNKDMTDEWGSPILQASAATPGIFPPVKIAGDVYVDGGVVMNTPLECAIRAGATTLHVIYLDPDVGTIPIRRLQNTLDTLSKMFTIMFATVANEDIDHAREINLGLGLLDRIARGETVSDHHDLNLIRFAGWVMNLKRPISYRKLTIHRYRPVGELGGSMGMLNFNQDVIVNSIARGLNDTINHDCASSHCVLPD